MDIQTHAPGKAIETLHRGRLVSLESPLMRLSAPWLRSASLIALATATACSKRPDSEPGLFLSLLLPILGLTFIVVLIGAVVCGLTAMNAVVKGFLTRVCDADDPATPTPRQGIPPRETSISSPELNSPEPCESRATRVVVGAGVSLLSLLILFGSSAQGRPSAWSELGWIAWLYYWALVFGPYYAIGYWGGPRPGGSSSRIVLLLLAGFIAIGWTYHLGY